MIYVLLTKKIESGNFDKEDLLKKIDVYFMANRLTKEEYETLVKKLG